MIYQINTKSGEWKIIDVLHDGFKKVTEQELHQFIEYQKRAARAAMAKTNEMLSKSR
jgi:hypothetical protein